MPASIGSAETLCGYAAAGGPNQVVSASASPGSVTSPTQATYPSGRINTAAGAVTAPSAGSSHAPSYLASTRLNPIRPWRDVEAAGLTEVEQHRPGIVQQGEDPQRAVGGDQIEIGHAASEQRMSLAEIVVDVRGRTSPRRTVCAARPCRAARRWSRPGPWCGRPCGEARPAPSCCAARGRRPGAARHGRYRAGFPASPLDHLGQLPSQIHRILHADVEALSAHRGMHMRGVAGQQHAPVAVGRGLPGHVGEAGDPGGTVDPEIGAVDGDERLADIAQGGFAVDPTLPFGQHDPRPVLCHPPSRADRHGCRCASWWTPHFGSSAISTSAISQLDGRIPSGEFDAGRLADQAAAAIAADQISARSDAAVGQARCRRRCRPA